MKPARTSSRRARKPCILVAEHLDTARARLSVLLIGAGYEVLLAAKGERALHLGTTRRCDAALVELDLPDMNGLQVCHGLRAQPGLGRLPVVFTSRRPNGIMIRLVDQVAHSRLLREPLAQDLVLAALQATIGEAARWAEEAKAER